MRKLSFRSHFDAQKNYLNKKKVTFTFPSRFCVVFDQTILTDKAEIKKGKNKKFNASNKKIESKTK